MNDTMCPFLRVKDVSSRTGISIREIWRKAASEADFPKPRKLSPRRTVWLEDEVAAWVEGEIKRLHRQRRAV
jgi:predicted DNA-binding transcriptional regulator AlpA